MQCARPFGPFTMCLQISRCISSSNVCSNISREGKFLKKIMQGSRKSRRKWHDTELYNFTSVNPTNKSLSNHITRRMVVRDKLFMQHITDMISMEQVSDIIKGGLEITHVKITSDFKCVNVFYIPNTSFDQEALQKCARIIRHELSQLRVIGVVPPIQFVQNKEHFMMQEVERRLTMINEDDEILSEQTQLDVSDVGDVDQTDEFYIQLPVMRHDVLGLDHHKIMSRITVAMSKSKKAAQRRMLDVDTDIDESSRDPASKVVAEFVTQEEQQKALSEFLKEKRSNERRRYREQQRLNKQRLSNNFEEEIDDEEIDYEDDVDIYKYADDDIYEYADDDIDDFQDEKRK